MDSPEAMLLRVQGPKVFLECIVLFAWSEAWTRQHLAIPRGRHVPKHVYNCLRERTIAAAQHMFVPHIRYSDEATNSSSHTSLQGVFEPAVTQVPATQEKVGEGIADASAKGS